MDTVIIHFWVSEVKLGIDVSVTDEMEEDFDDAELDTFGEISVVDEIFLDNFSLFISCVFIKKGCKNSTSLLYELVVRRY